MKRITYYVAVSIDGFICGENEDISMFSAEGNGVEKYLDDLKDFDTVIMGRKTYEFGYKYGMKPGELAYPHMNHYIFSSSLSLATPHKKIRICKPQLEIIKELKSGNGSDIYLCGGGEFAGWLLDNEFIDILKIKLNPILIGSGTSLFGDTTKSCKLQLISSEKYDHGLQIIEYRILY